MRQKIFFANFLSFPGFLLSSDSLLIMEVDTSPNSKSPNQIGAKKRKKLILRLYGLPAFCNLRDLKTFLQNYGPIKHLIVSKGRKSATVAYANSEHAQRVLDFKTIRFGEVSFLGFILFSVFRTFWRSMKAIGSLF